jgi:hypothetical protein
LGIGGKDYHLDLLFYHLHLRCYVVIDLKVEEFKPDNTAAIFCNENGPIFCNENGPAESRPFQSAPRHKGS